MNIEQERAELLPCPFCGEPAYVERWGSNRQSCIIGCQSCGCSMETGETGHDCGGMWNRRAALQSQDREDEDLKEALLLALEYWADRQQRYKNRSPVWVQKARAALGIDRARRVDGDGE